MVNFEMLLEVGEVVVVVVEFLYDDEYDDDDDDEVQWTNLLVEVGVIRKVVVVEVWEGVDEMS